MLIKLFSSQYNCDQDNSIQLALGLSQHQILLLQGLDWHQCGNILALCYFAVVMELQDSLWMNCKAEFGVIFLRCSPT